ncbi:hypothetical protein KJ951_02630 [Patescibacteria group bacterium]|nr:hypothetical protein [Patescibacteria group bacterium]
MASQKNSPTPQKPEGQRKVRKSVSSGAPASQPAPQEITSTYPPPAASRQSGQFSIEPTTKETAERVGKTLSSDEEFIVHWISKRTRKELMENGPFIVAQFSIFRNLPYCIRDTIEKELINYLYENTIKENDTLKMPAISEIESEIVRLVFMRNCIQTLTNNMADLTGTAIKIMLGWLDNEQVQIYMNKHRIDFNQIKKDLLALHKNRSENKPE